MIKPIVGMIIELHSFDNCVNLDRASNHQAGFNRDVEYFIRVSQGKKLKITTILNNRTKNSGFWFMLNGAEKYHWWFNPLWIKRVCILKIRPLP